MANKKRKEMYMRQPMPIIWTYDDLTNDYLESGIEGVFEYKQKANESSEIKKIIVYCHPTTTITITYTVGGRETTVMNAVPLKNLPIESGGYIVPLKWESTDKALTIGRNEYFYVKLNQSLGYNLYPRINIFRDQMLWMPVVEEDEE